MSECRDDWEQWWMPDGMATARSHGSRIAEDAMRGQPEVTPVTDDELARLRKAFQVHNDAICQILGEVLGFPWYKDDQKNFPGTTVEDGVCVGHFVAEDLAEMAAAEIRFLRARLPGAAIDRAVKAK